MQAQRQPPELPNWLYILVVGALGLYMVIGGVAWALIAYEGRDVPDGFATLLATIAGGLIGIVTHAGPSRSGQRAGGDGSGGGSGGA